MTRIGHFELIVPIDCNFEVYELVGYLLWIDDILILIQLAAYGSDTTGITFGF